ncbi:MAG: hypothetical protein HY791_21485 [Deltaproteobacteria bacterium]|nr:hypothetical protein [Deltaproteobacteria bacterium]
MSSRFRSILERGGSGSLLSTLDPTGALERVAAGLKELESRNEGEAPSEALTNELPRLLDELSVRLGAPERAALLSLVATSLARAAEVGHDGLIDAQRDIDARRLKLFAGLSAEERVAAETLVEWLRLEALWATRPPPVEHPKPPSLWTSPYFFITAATLVGCVALLVYLGLTEYTFAVVGSGGTIFGAMLIFRILANQHDDYGREQLIGQRELVAPVLAAHPLVGVLVRRFPKSLAP